jgi:hypothetical protein
VTGTLMTSIVCTSNLPDAISNVVCIPEQIASTQYYCCATYSGPCASDPNACGGLGMGLRCPPETTDPPAGADCYTTYPSTTDVVYCCQ